MMHRLSILMSLFVALIMLLVLVSASGPPCVDLLAYPRSIEKREML